MSLYNKIIDLQKLSAAWNRVRRNKPAAGVDNITWQQFDENSREELKNLQTELADHIYMPLPVRNVTLYKGEKARKIALYSMRDKVVQQSLAAEIVKLYDGRLSQQSYAYRDNKSALQAVEDLSAEILTSEYNAVLKTDITHFFDNISWNILREKLCRTIKEEDVLELIRLNACTAILDEETGEIAEKTVGIHQGSAIAPILSNIFLMDFDIALARPGFFYVRYSDDILVLGEKKEKLISFLNEIKTRLEELGLFANEDKTLCCNLSEGVDFLGYHFDASGKSIPAKAEDRLYDRLETMWLTNPTLNVEEKAAKALEISGGWQQYYRGERGVQSIYEYIAFAFAVGGRKELIERLEQDRIKVENACKDIAEYLSLFWKKNEKGCLELLEYEQYYGLPEKEYHRPALNEGRVRSLLELYRKHFVLEGEDTSTDLMQVYTDMQEYTNAQYWMEQTDCFRARNERFSTLSRRKGYAGNLAINIPELKKEHSEAIVRTEAEQKESEADGKASTSPGEQLILNITGHTPLLMLEAFSGRDDIYSIETVIGNQRRRTELQERPLTESQIEEHLRGEHTIGTYVQRPNSTVRYIVWDIDISKQFILKYGSSGESFDACLQHAYHKALEIQKLLDDKGIHCYIEFSGYRGYHVWLFLSEWIPVRFANMLTDRIEEEMVIEDDITVECFPNKVRLKSGRIGQVIKIPCGIHVRSGRRSCFVDDDGQPVTDIDNFMETLAHYPLSTIRKVLSYAMTSKGGIALTDKETQVNVFDKQSDQDLQDTFSELNANVQEILMRCSLMKYLCLKAKRTGYLTHFERLSILYVFGHVGEEGKEFVHDVMRLTMNYQYNVTQRFIDRLPEKPVSCLKLREQYKKISAEVGCSCSFKRTKNCYPSPVLHALSLSTDVQEDITLPVSRTLSGEKGKKVIDELNVHKKAQELAGRILELRKQQRSLVKSVAKVERELEKIYDIADTNALEIEMGVLVRRKKENGYEWVIEI